MLGRFFSLDGLLTFLGLFACGAAVATVAGAPGWSIPVAGLATAVVLFLPAGLWVQDYLVGFHVDAGRYEEALAIVHRVMESAPARKLRERARADLGLIHYARGDARLARDHLEKAAKAPMKPLARAVVEGHLAGALAHLGEDLERAEELARRSLAEVAPEDAAMFEHFLGLVQLRRGDAAGARQRFETSLGRDPEERDPCPGERRYALAEALRALGEHEAARVALTAAAAATPRSPFVERASIELAATAPPESSDASS